DYGGGRSKRAARRAWGGGGTSKGKGGAAAGRRGATRNRHGDDDESEESCETGDDSEDEESEGEFDDEDDSSDGDGGSDDEPELTDASSSNGDSNSNSNPNEEEGERPSASAAAAAAVHSPTLDANAAGILAIAEADDLAKVQARARAKAKAKAASEEAAAQGEEKNSAAAGGGGANAVVVVDDDDRVEVTGVKAAAAGVSGKGPSGSGGNKQGKKRRRVVDSDEDSSDDGGGGGDVVEVVAAPPTSKPSKKEKKKKKKKKRQSSGYDDDGMDGSDRGSDSDADEGARARKVLSECSALSKKLASVISTWAGSTTTTATEEGGSAAGVGGGRGALEICSLKGGGKAVTTNEEVQEACPGLKLNPYQLVGVNWMCLLRDTNVNGVLADEMGLGKTVQSIAFFALLKHRRKGAPPRRPHLVVVPSSVLDNWASELEKFCPALDLVKYHGSQKERAAMRHSLNRVASDADREAMPDIILTTYVVWERESSADDRAFLKRFRYDYMVLDEGHSIKNIKSSRFQRLRVVAAKHRLLLSGTPVQNNLGELLALLSFLMPEIFRSDVIETLLEFLGNNADEQASSSSFQVREVRGMLAPFVLRRLKSDVLKQLVAKNESLEKVPLSKVAKEVSGYSDFDLHQVCSGFDSLKHLCLSEETLFTSA
ncbi:unnamed protein product, partial [Ectocarpus sp. 12 AP-2014]